MGIEPTHRLLGGAQDLKSWEGTSPQPLPFPSSENYRKFKVAQALAAVKRNDNTAERKSVAAPAARFPPMTSLQVGAFALPYNRG
jgi:hypothetical protein